jgi:hypothetical protein
MAALRSPKDNHHSGQWFASEAEGRGAGVRETESGYAIYTDEGTVYVPNRELHPCESRTAKHLLRMIGIVICVFFLAAFACLLTGGMVVPG